MQSWPYMVCRSGPRICPERAMWNSFSRNCRPGEEPGTMVIVNENTLLAVVDRIYESVERQELWPETIRAIGEFIGGRRDLWDVDPNSRGSTASIPGAGCHPTMFLSRRDLAAL